MVLEDTVRVRRITRPEMDWAIEMAAGEGWNPGLNDADCFYRADPQGYFIAVSGEEPVGCVSAVRYGDAFGFGGFYIVRPEWRGKGVGRLLVEAAFEHFGRRTVGMDAVAGMHDTYRSMGFEVAFTSTRYSGDAGGGGDGPVDRTLVPLRDIDPADLSRFDRGFFRAPRERFLRCWIKMPESAGLARVLDGELAGYSVIRRCRVGHKVGPLFAGDPETAELLFDALCSSVAGERVILDVPVPNDAGGKLAESRGMEPDSELGRMYRGRAPALPLEQVFGVTTFELG